MSTALLAMTPFAEWFENELKRRKISRSQAAAFIGTRPQTVSAWFTHDAKPSPALCQAISEWAKVSPEFVMRLAGHLPPEGWDDATKTLHLKPGPARLTIGGPPVLPEVIELLQTMTPEEQREFALPAIELAESLLRRGQRSAQ